jgi:hypothetical protein
MALSAFRMAGDAENEPRRFVLAGAFLLIGIILFGPGYGPQYIAWFLPLLVLTATAFDAVWLRIVASWGIIAILTYLAEYLLLQSHGALLLHLFPQHNFAWTNVLSTSPGLTLLRLPLFVAYAVLWVKAGTILIRSQPTPA